MESKRYEIQISRRAQKDIDALTPRLRAKLQDILRYQVAVNPHEGMKLVGDLKGYWSVRLSYQDRIVYRIDEERQTVYVLRARTHYQP
ncbi:type II toxin-antitoxin system YoeB family toxin [Acidobacteria bacterium AH-259-A15]|nr:type II toxin-antitoxin system YoeB family toxin [Acidobacteria bacterium AH-259-A15]